MSVMCVYIICVYVGCVYVCVVCMCVQVYVSDRCEYKYIVVCV